MTKLEIKGDWNITKGKLKVTSARYIPPYLTLPPQRYEADHIRMSPLS